ncbi:MAG TPA: FecR family protein, partial [Roseimicrobium sp.]|nr:FecR family protein [Roseimicrobium sp.]
MSNDEIIELTTLCSALADGTLTAAQKERLNALLRESEEARQFHVRYTDLSASLYSYAAEMQSEAPTAKIVQSGIPWRTTLLAVAAMAMLTLIVWFSRIAPAPLLQPELVALVTGTKDCVWSAAPLQAGERVQAGRRIDLKIGFAEITFDSGAQVTLEGPASLVVSSAWDAALVNGALKAKVPEEAIGFRISHPSVEVVDLGTEFSMIADGTDAEVLVLKGSVETSGKGEAKSLVLRETESRRFGRDGVSTVRDHERKFARFARLQKLDRPAVNVDFAHWTFDDATGTPLFKQAKSRKKGAAPAQLDSEGT